MDMTEERARQEQPVYGRREVFMTMIVLLLIMFLGTLDQTITATALPRIVGDLQDFGLATWVSTIYLMTSTVTVPVYGKFSDQFGRKPILFVGLGLFLAGSILSGISQSMMQLIVFRALQGLGAGALVPTVSATVGDLFLPRERAKWIGATAGASGVATIIGPILGGWLTDHTSWRWVFYVNVPVGLLLLLALLFVMPRLSRTARNVTVDYVGAALLILGTALRSRKRRQVPGQQVNPPAVSGVNPALQEGKERRRKGRARCHRHQPQSERQLLRNMTRKKGT
jgi:multidrug resistance protein